MKLSLIAALSSHLLAVDNQSLSLRFGLFRNGIFCRRRPKAVSDTLTDFLTCLPKLALDEAIPISAIEVEPIDLPDGLLILLWQGKSKAGQC
ncbi:MAG: hypothetical protein LBJ64_10560 [Deltaproteobacteria bacterium]|nr:hypothetical protein [Deltaproteobacteria bacterium]